MTPFTLHPLFRIHDSIIDEFKTTVIISNDDLVEYVKPQSHDIISSINRKEYSTILTDDNLFSEINTSAASIEAAEDQVLAYINSTEVPTFHYDWNQYAYLNVFQNSTNLPDHIGHNVLLLFINQLMAKMVTHCRFGMPNQIVVSEPLFNIINTITSFSIYDNEPIISGNMKYKGKISNYIDVWQYNGSIPINGIVVYNVKDFASGVHYVNNSNKLYFMKDNQNIKSSWHRYYGKFTINKGLPIANKPEIRIT